MTPEQHAIFEHIAQEALRPRANTPYLIGVNGKDAAGKTVFSDALAEYFKTKTDRQIIRTSIDDFMNPRAIRDTSSSSPAECAYLYTFDFEAFKKYALEPLQPGGSRTYKTKIFDETTDKPDVAKDSPALPDAIAIIDGVLLFKDTLADYFSLKILLDVSDDTAMQRGIERDKARGKTLTDEELRAYRSIYIDCQAMYYQKDRPLERADIIIDNNDYQHPKLTDQ